MTSSSRLRIAAFHAAIVFAALTGCKEANTVTGIPPTPTPSPTPAAPPSLSNISGNWEGTMLPKGCSGAFPVTAAITQTGNVVTGRLAQTGCPETFNVLDFTGTYQDGVLEGTTTGADFPGTISGSLSGTTLGIHAYTRTNSNPNFDLGPIELHPGGAGH